MNTTQTRQDGFLKVDAIGRVRTSAERREAILDEFEKSGMPGTRFARQYGIKYTTFANWAQKRRRDRGDYPKVLSVREPRPRAAEKHGQESTAAQSALMLAEVIVGGGKSEATAPAAVRIELPGGASLTVTDASQTAIAAELIRQLSTKPIPC
jgi:transposase-like protein